MTGTRINFWSSPRNISTALMYSFAQHPDVAVVDEPLYAHYLKRQPTEAHHPGRKAILASQPQDGREVIRWMLTHDFGRSAVVFKQMTHHLVELDLDFLSAMTNVLLIRDPRAILASYSKVVDRVSNADIGVQQQFALFQRLRADDALAAVVDSRRLLLDPPGVLKRLCARLGLSFTEDMLSWPRGGRPEDGVWAPFWYANVHRSTGFAPYAEKVISLPDHLEELAAANQPLYATLLQEAL